MSFKLPVSVLVVVHTADLEVLLIERATRPGFWQSVTGSLERGTLRRWKLAYTFEIYPQWRHRFGPGVTYNTEHVLSLALPRRAPVTLAPGEHTDFAWLPWREAALRCFSWSNRDAIVMLGEGAVIT